MIQNTQENGPDLTTTAAVGDRYTKDMVLATICGVLTVADTAIGGQIVSSVAEHDKPIFYYLGAGIPFTGGCLTAVVAISLIEQYHGSR